MGSKGSQTVKQDQTYTPNPVAGAAITGALNQTQQVAQTPFQTPVAPVAGFSGDQGYGFDTMRNAVGSAQPYLQSAANYFSPQGVQDFLNPYASNVLAGMKDVFGQQMSQTTGNLTQQAGGTGADRIAIGQSQLARQQDLATGQTMSDLYSRAAQEAQGAGFGMGSIGPAIQNMMQQGAQGVLGTGGLQQQLQQAQMNAPYQNILQRIAWPYQNAQFLNQGVSALAPGLGGTTNGQTTYPGASPWGTIAGVGMAGLGAYGGAGGFSGSGKGGVPADPYVNADTDPSLIGQRGGRVPGYAEGGEVDDPDDLGGMVSTHPLNETPQSLIPQGQLTPIKPNIPQLPQPQKGGGGGGSDWSQAIGTALKIGTMFLNRGGAVRGYATGGAPSGGGGLKGVMSGPSGLGHAMQNMTQSMQGGGPWSVLPQLVHAFGQGAQPGSPTAPQGAPGLQQLMRSGGLKGMMGGAPGGGMPGGGMPWWHRQGAPPAGGQPTGGQPTQTMADGGEVEGDYDLPSSMADVSRSVPGYRDVSRDAGLPRGLMRPESPDLAGETLRALPRAAWPHTSALIAGEDTPPPEIEGEAPGKVPSFENQHVMGAIPELLETAGTAIPAGRLASGAARMAAPLAREAGAGTRTLQHAALGATGAAAASPAGADEIDDISKPSREEQTVIDRVAPLIALKKKEYRDKYESKKMEDSRPAIRLKAEIRDLQDELNKVEGPGTDLAARREQARRLRAEQISRTQVAGEGETDRLRKVNEPFATRHPDDVEWRRQNMPAVSGLTGLTAGLLSRGRPLRALAYGAPMGAAEGAWAAGRPTFDDMAFLPSGPNQKAAADRFWGRGDEDWWSNRVLPDAMMHAGYAGAGALVGSEATDVAGRLGRGARGLANWARGRGAAAAPAGEGVIAKAPALEQAAEAGAGRTATLPDKTVIKRFEYPQRDGTTRIKYHNGKSWVARKNLKGVPEDFARGGGNPYFADGGAPDFEDSNPWTPELNDRFNASADPYPGEDPRSPQYQMPGAWNGERKVTDAKSFPPQEDDSLPQEAEPAAWSGRRRSAGALPAPTGGGGGYGSPGSEKGFMDGPWGALMMAGLGTMAASGQRDARGLPTPPLAAIGQGGMQGMGMLQKQRENTQKQQTIDQGAERLRQQADLHRVQMMAPVKIGQDRYGRDIYGVRDPQTGQIVPVNPMNGQPGQVPPTESGAGAELPTERAAADPKDLYLPPSARPTAAMADNVNSAALEGMSPEDIERVKAIAEGRRKSMSETGRNNPYARYIMGKVHEYDKEFDDTTFQRRQRTANFFAVGTQGGGGQNIAAMNTWAQHLDHYLKLTQELGLGQYTDWNSLKVALGQRGYTGEQVQDKLKELEITNKALADEGAKVFAGSNSALGDREEWLRRFALNTPAKAALAGAQTAEKLVEGRLNSLTDMYNKGMRTSHQPHEMISPETKEVMERIKKSGGEGGYVAKGAAETAAPKAQEGEMKQFKQGWGIFKDGKWQPYTPQGPRP